MIGVFVVGNVVYYVQGEKLLGYATIKELGDTTQTTVMVIKEVKDDKKRT